MISMMAEEHKMMAHSPPHASNASSPFDSGRSDAATNSADGGGAAGEDAPSSDGRSPTAVILEPARDLCEQVHQCVVEFARFFSEPPVRAALFVGGVDAGGQMKSLKAGVDIVSGTPGRLMDLVQSGKLHLGDVQFFVLDEADRLLDTGNLDTIMKLYAKLPKKGRSGGRLQTLLFSATLHTADVRALADRITQHPTLVDLKGKDSVPETVHHVVVHIDPQADVTWATPPLPVPTDAVHKADAVATHLKSQESLSEGVKRLKPLVLLRIVEKLQMSQCLIFCRTNLDCDNLEKYLNNLGGGGFRGKVRGVAYLATRSSSLRRTQLADGPPRRSSD